jgi:quaternary ammonium compound-resistance protein SugE
MYWLIVVIAGLLETGWAIGLKASEGLTRPWVSLWTLVAVVASMGLLALALKHLPVSSAYVAWVGIGAVGTVVVGAIWLDEPMTPLRLGSAVLVLVGVIGLTRG